MTVVLDVFPNCVALFFFFTTIEKHWYEKQSKPRGREFLLFLECNSFFLHFMRRYVFPNFQINRFYTWSINLINARMKNCPRVRFCVPLAPIFIIRVCIILIIIYALGRYVLRIVISGCACAMRPRGIIWLLIVVVRGRVSGPSPPPENRTGGPGLNTRNIIRRTRKRTFAYHACTGSSIFFFSATVRTTLLWRFDCCRRVRGVTAHKLNISSRRYYAWPHYSIVIISGGGGGGRCEFIF